MVAPLRAAEDDDGCEWAVAPVNQTAAEEALRKLVAGLDTSVTVRDKAYALLGSIPTSRNLYITGKEQERRKGVVLHALCLSGTLAPPPPLQPLLRAPSV